MNIDVCFIVCLLYRDSTVSLFSYLEIKMMAESKLVSSIFKRRTVKNNKIEKVVDWPWYVQCGKCAKQFTQRTDSDTNGRLSDFKIRKNYMRHFISHNRKFFSYLFCFIFIFRVLLRKCSDKLFYKFTDNSSLLLPNSYTIPIILLTVMLQ